MDKGQAYRQAKKRWGKTAFVRISDRGISSPERRAVALEQLRAARAEREALQRELNEKLAACDWYQEFMGKMRDARKRQEAAQHEAFYKRFDVGRSNSLFAEILGSGDTFEQAFTEADGRKIQ